MSDVSPSAACPACRRPMPIPRPRARHDVTVFSCPCGKRWLAELVGVFERCNGSSRLMTWDLARELAEVG